ARVEARTADGSAFVARPRRRRLGRPQFRSVEPPRGRGDESGSELPRTAASPADRPAPVGPHAAGALRSFDASDQTGRGTAGRPDRHVAARPSFLQRSHSRRDRRPRAAPGQDSGPPAARAVTPGSGLALADHGTLLYTVKRRGGTH